MPRKELFLYSHSVLRTRKGHKCEGCGKIIPKGSPANYNNLFTGRRGYLHISCTNWSGGEVEEKEEENRVA